jgi:transposase-like protein
MALTGTLLADFSAFQKEAADSTAALKTMGQGADQAAAQMAKVPAPVEDSAKAFSGLSQRIVETMTGMVSADAIVGATSEAFHTLTEFVSESVAAYSKQEDATVQLTAALRTHGLATAPVIEQYNALATTFQATTKYADEDIQAMEKLLTLVGNVMPSQMQAALKASTDLAAGLGIDLQQATMLVAKAAEGHTTALGRYGITVDAADVKSRGLAAVLDVINEKFGGQAAAAIETYSGRIAQAANAWDNVKEALGKIIIEDPLVTAALNHMAAATKDADTAATNAHKTLPDLIADFGLIDHVTADAINGIDAYVDSVNTMAQAQRMAAAVPSPFEKMAKDGSLPAITAGLELNTKLLKEHEEQVKKDAAALAEWQKATDAITASTVGWQTTLDTLDGTVVEAIQYYLSAGVSQGDLAKAYGVTAQQVAAVKIALEDYARALTETADLEKAEADQRKVIEQAMLKATNDRILAEFQKKQAAEASEAAFLKANLADAQAQDAIQQGIQTTTAAATESADVIGTAYTTHFKAAKDSFEQFQGVVVAGTAEMIAGLTSFHDSGAYVQMQKDMRDVQNARGGFYIDTGFAPPPVQTRDSGGPVVAGTSYLIGGGKAPEIFTPGASGFVTPGGGGGGGGVTQNIYITHPLGTPDAIARAVGDAQVALLKGQGMRLPYGT